MSKLKKTLNYYDEGQIQRVKTSTSKEGAIYYNISIQSGLSSQNGGVLAYYRESKLSSILDKCNDYYMSVARFSVTTNTIPLLIPKVVIGQANINKLIYTFTIRYNGIASLPINVTYVSQNTVTSLPLPPLVSQDTSGSYYFIYNVDSFLQMCNTAIATAFASIVTPVGSLPPYFQYDPITQLISLVAQQAYYDQNPATGPLLPIYLESNSDAQLLLTRGINSIYNGYFATNAFRYKIYNNKNNYYNPSNLVVSSPPLYLITTNDFSLFDLWTPLSAIVLTSGTIPTRDENIQPPNVTGNVNQNVGSSTITSQKIITDFEPDFYQIMQSRGIIQYGVTGNGNMRFIKLESSSPLNTIDLQFNWLDDIGILRPLYLFSGISSIKLVFVPKNQVDSFKLDESLFN